MGSILERLAEACGEDEEECRRLVREFLSSVCKDPTLCEQPPRRARLAEKYSWIETLIEEGVPDGRSRLILYVVSRYLVNIKGLEPEDAILEVRKFIDNSCQKHGNCSKIYDSWIRNVLRRVKEGGWLPWSLERIKERDPELYEIVAAVLGA